MNSSRYNLRMSLNSSAGLFGNATAFAGTQANEAFFGPLNSGIHRFIAGRSSGDDYEADRDEELQFEIVYLSSDTGAFSDVHGRQFNLLPNNPSPGTTTQREMAEIDDLEESIKFENTEDAVEESEVDGAPINGLLDVQLVNTSPVIPAGLNYGDSEVVWYTKDNYFEEDLRLIIEVPGSIEIDQNGDEHHTVDEGYATPGIDFSIKYALHGRKNGFGQTDLADLGQTEIARKPNGSIFESAEIDSLGSLREGFLHYAVSDFDSDTWITVSGSQSAGYWNRIEFVVVPVADQVIEGEEVFEVYLEAKVNLPNDSTPITGITEITEFINLDTTTVRIADTESDLTDDGVDESTPRGEGDLESDGICACPCSCIGGFPVRPKDGAISLGPQSPGGDGGPASFGPSYYSMGSQSTEQTARLALPYDRIQTTSPVDPTSALIRFDVGNGSGTAADSSGLSVLASSTGYTLDFPPIFGDLGGDDSIAVRLPISLPSDTATGAYKLSTRSVAKHNDDTVGLWTAETPILVSNIQTDYDLAPGWTFPFDYKLVVGTVGGGMSDVESDQGASLFRPNQSASYFEKSGSNFIAPPETFEQLFTHGSGYGILNPDKSTLEFELDQAGSQQSSFRLKVSTDASGNATTYAYDGAGRISKLTDSLGRDVDFSWVITGNTRTLTITDWRGRSTQYQFDSSANQVTIDHPSVDGGTELREVFGYQNGQITSVQRLDSAGGDAQTTSIGYQSYGPNSSLTRVASVTQPDGERLVISSLGIDDALPSSDGNWVNSSQWGDSVGSVGPFSSNSRLQLMDSYWADAWSNGNGISEQSFDSAGLNLILSRAQGIPRSGLEHFEDYASYSTLAKSFDGSPVQERVYEMTLDRRGRLVASEDPDGNVTHVERKVETEPESELVRLDRGEILTQTGPDPDRFLINGSEQNGPLGRPITTFKYEGGTPFVSKVDLPNPDGPNSFGTSYEQQTTGYVAGQPTRVVDELGNLTFYRRDGNGIPTSVVRIKGELFDGSAWTNGIDRFDVSSSDPAEISSLDALLIINAISRRNFMSDDGTLDLPRPADATEYYDVNGDGKATAFDALLVINELARSGTATREAGVELERTDLVYVNTPEYSDLLGGIGGTGTVSADFHANGLLGAQITRTGRDGDGDRVQLYTYYLDDSSSAAHGQVARVYDTELNPDGSVDFGSDAALTQFFYDQHGFLNRLVDPIGRETLFQNDALGRVTQITTPAQDPLMVNGGSSQPFQMVINRRFDAFGNLFQSEAVGQTLEPEQQFDSSGNAYYVSRPVIQKQLTTYLYDQENRLVAVVDPSPDANLDASLETPAIVDSADLLPGSIQAVSDRPITRYFYDDFGQVRRTTQTLGKHGSANADLAVTDYEYDRLGRLTRQFEPTVGVVDDSGVTVTQERPETNFYYNAAGTTRLVVDAEGLQTGFTYDIWGRVIAETAAEGSGGTIGAELRTTNYDYFKQDHEVDEARFVVANSGWATKATTFDTSGSILSASLHAYDQDERLKESSYLLSESGDGNQRFDDGDQVSVTSYSYFSDGSLAEIVDPRGNRTEYQYDSLGRVDVVTDSPVPVLGQSTPVPSVTTYHYDPAGQLIRSVDPTGVETVTSYDGLGNPDRTTVATPSATNIFNQSITDWDYDAFSRLVSQVRNPDDFTEPTAITGANQLVLFDVQANSFDRLGRRTESLEGFRALTQYNYDRGSRQTELIDPNGNTTEWQYDGINRVLSETTQIDDGSGTAVDVTRRYFYDAVSNLRHRVDRNGRVTQYEYDPLHQLQAEIWFTADQVNTAALAKGASVGGINFQYDAIGRLLNVGDQGVADQVASHQYEYVYDIGGRLTDELQLFFTADSGPTSPLSVGWNRVYDPANNLESVTSFLEATLEETPADGNLTGIVDHYDSFEYDAQDRLESITRWVGSSAETKPVNATGSQHVGFQYDAAGRTRSIDRYAASEVAGLALTTTLEYDGAGRTKDIENTMGTFRSQYLTTWTQANRVRSTETQNNSNRVSSSTDDQVLVWVVFYDARGQVVEQRNVGGVFSDYTTNIETDASGNRINFDNNSGTADDSVSAIEIDNRLSDDSDWTYLYDPEGNLIEKIAKSGGERWVYDWDHRNRLVKASRFNNTALETTVENVYDAMNRWIGRIERNGNGVIQGQTTFAFDGQQVGLQFDGAGQVTDRYLWSEGVDQLLAEQDAATGDTAWVLTDYLGNVRDRVNESGVLLSHTDYDAFGRADGPTNYSHPTVNAKDVIFGYTGRLLDNETKLQNNTNRWYDAETGRWLSKDPIGFDAGDANLYRYVGNQPTTLTDPSGLMPPTHNPVNTIEQAANKIRELFALWDNTAHMSPAQRGYVVGGTIIADMVGVRGVSDACSRHDAIDGHVQSASERIMDGVLGSVQLVGTAAGISGGIGKVIVKVRGPLAPGKLTASELRELQKIADEFDTEIHVVGSRASGKGRNINTDFPVGKNPKNATRSDIDCRVDGSHPRAGEVGKRINSTDTANVDPVKHDFSTRRTVPPSIIIRPNNVPKVR